MVAACSEPISPDTSPPTTGPEAWAYAGRLDAPLTGAFGAALVAGDDFIAVGDPRSARCGADHDVDSCEGQGFVLTSGASFETPLPIAGRPHRLGEYFGASLSTDGPYLVVGAPAATVRDAEAAGAVYIFARDAPQSGQWHLAEEISAPVVTAGAGFGESVAIFGRWLAVAAPGESVVSPPTSEVWLPPSGHPAPGAVHMYTSDEDGWRFYQTVGLPILAEGRGVLSLALDADALYVGVPHDARDSPDPSRPVDDPKVCSGAVVVFRWRDAQWVQDAYLKPTRIIAAAAFGTAVSVQGTMFAVGAPGLGAVYAAPLHQDGWRPAEIQIPGGRSSRFGAEVRVLEDQIWVGAPENLNCATGVIAPGRWVSGCDGAGGAVHQFIRDRGGDWARNVTFKADVSGGNIAFGAAFDVTANRLYVGAPDHPTGGGKGVVYVYSKVTP